MSLVSHPGKDAFRVGEVIEARACPAAATEAAGPVGALAVRRITDLAGFRALRTAWNELVEASPDGALYARHEWFEQWILAHRVEGSLAIVTLWRGGRLIGAAPLFRTELVFRGVQARSLSFIWSAVAPRCNFLLAEVGDLSALLDAVLATPDFDVLVVENLAVESTTTRGFLAELRRRGVAHQVVESFQSPYRVLEPDFESYWTGLDRERRRSLQKKCINRLESRDGVEFSRIHSADELEAFLPEMIDLSARSWKATRGTPFRSDDPDSRLLIGFARLGLERGWVRIEALRVEGVLVAFEYMLVDGGRHVVARSDYDEAYKYYAPGNSLRLRILRSLLDDPTATEYDLAGGDAPYKRDWCNALRSHVTVTVGTRTLRGRVILSAKNTWLPLLRRLRGAGPSTDEAST